MHDLENTMLERVSRGRKRKQRECMSSNFVSQFRSSLGPERDLELLSRIAARIQ